jgi:cyclopropane-fatty-acyl-phospholipid synthase
MMVMSKSTKIVEELLSHADIEINGSRPWDIQLKNARLFDDVLSRGSIALGEGYMQGYWDAERVDEFIFRVLASHLDEKVKINLDFIMQVLHRKFVNIQSKNRAFRIGEQHYDLGNDLYEAMLDKRMVYTCAYWRNADNLDDAQAAKLKLVCDKLHLKPGMRVLDIGCGWGSFAKYAAENYGVEVVGITVSKEQVALGMARCKGLPVDLRLQDYRDIDELFDRVVSLGMFEHVGAKNYNTYMQVAERCLKDKGLFLLHTIGNAVTQQAVDPWINKYIFPGGKLPSVVEIAKAAEGRFIMEDWHNFGADYDTTLMAWHKNFMANWEHLKSNYDETFKRMWEYYLLSCAGSFRARYVQLWQVTLSKGVILGGVESFR